MKTLQEELNLDDATYTKLRAEVCGKIGTCYMDVICNLRNFPELCAKFRGDMRDKVKNLNEL